MSIDWTLLLGPAVVAAVISILFGAISLLVTTRSAHRLLQERIQADIRIAEHKAKEDLALTEARHGLDRAAEEMRRHTELAEDTLANFYRARQVFVDARRTMVHADEGKARPGRPDDDNNLERFRDAAYLPYSRLQAEREFLAELQSTKFRFLATFGKEFDEAFLVLTTLSASIAYASNQLMLVREEDLNNEVVLSWRHTLGMSPPTPDPLQVELDRAVEMVEKACRPWLSTKVEEIQKPSPKRTLARTDWTDRMTRGGH